ncbi:MAG: hypothetical protein B7Z39_02830 [Novosphingobium sp. 12-64-8]|nr:MAG: hypothetical protein B7Z39_02830 [Novosphingobium sp. 12-64-8]
MKIYGALLSGPGNPDPAFLAASPMGKIPAIDDDGFTLADSSAIVAYIEAKWPTPCLIPTEAQARGRTIWFDEFADTIMGVTCGKILFNRVVGPKVLKVGGDEAVALQGEAELPRVLDYIESVVPADGWLLGADFGLADIAVASVFRSLEYVGHGPVAAKRPLTAAWYDRVRARDSWQAVAAKEAKLSAHVMAL